MIEEKLYTAVDDPTQAWVAPKPRDPVPHLNFAPLHNAMAGLRKSTDAYEQAMGQGDRRALDGAARPAERDAADERARPDPQGGPAAAARGTGTRSTLPVSTPATA